MKTIFKPFLALVVAVLTLAGCSDANVPKEGEHYTLIPHALPEGANSEVVEVFSLTCGHCRKMEEAIPEIKRLANTEIDKVHVTFNESSQIAAFIYYTAAIQSGGKPDDAFVAELFAIIQDSGTFMTDELKPVLSEAFTKRGFVSPYEPDQALKEKIYAQLSLAETVVNSAQIQSVPGFLVKGKYLVQTSAHENIEDIANTINYLKTLKGN